MTEDHQHYRGWAASYVLGALDADDRRAFEAHVSRCQTCAADLNGFAPLPSLLAKVDPSTIDVGPTAESGESLAAEAGAYLSGLRASERRWQATAFAAATVAAALAAVLIVDRDPATAPVRQPTTILASMASETNVLVTPKGWGTEIVLNIANLPERDGYLLWTVDGSGDWTNAASWSPTQSGGVRLIGASRIPLDQVERIVVTSLDRDDVLVEASN